MTNMFDDLAEFLTACVDEDEREIRNDPPVGLGYASLAARMSREVTGKREILRRCAAVMNEMDIYPNGLVSPRAFLARQTLMNMGIAYDDHPGYRAEDWKP